MAKLGPTERKRDPAKTPEPFGGKAIRGAPIFVVQRTPHAACITTSGSSATARSRRGPCRRGSRSRSGPGRSRSTSRIIRSSTRSFEGEIPTGQYGAGTVEIWDHGTYELLEEKRDGGLTVRLDGKRLQGVWTLVPAHLDGKEQNWLLLRKPDERAKPAPRRHRYRPMLATLAERAAAGRRVALRGEVRRLPCARVRPRTASVSCAPAPTTT